MEVTRFREHTVNVGNFENVKIGGSVKLSDEDIEGLAEKEAVALADRMLDLLLARDLAEAAANVPEGRETHLDTWQKD